jgi:hypothetical protein
VAISILTLTAITADRFLAVNLHLRYQEVVTTKRVIIALGFIVAFGSCFSICSGIFYDKMGVIVFNACCVATLLLLNVYFIFRVWLVIRRHSKQIESQQSVQQTINMPRFRKSVKIVFYVIGAFVFCYVPFNACRLVVAKHDRRLSYAMRYGFIISETLVMFNGVLNPIIYCWRIEGIRNAAVLLLRKICRQNVN